MVVTLGGDWILQLQITFGPGKFLPIAVPEHHAQKKGKSTRF